MSPPDLARILLVVLLWGLNFVWIRVGLDGIPPLLLCAVRFFLSAFPAVLFIPRPKVPFRLLLGYGLASFAFQFGFLFTGMYLGVSPGLASLIGQTQAFFTMALAAWIFREKTGPWKIVGAVISFSGIMYVALRSNGDVSIPGLVLVLMAAFTWACGNMFSKKIGQAAALDLVVWGSFIAFPILAAVSLFIEGPERIVSSLTHLSLASIGAIAYIVYISTYVGYSLWVSLLNRYPASSVAPFSLLVPVFGFLGSTIFLGETLPDWKIIGSVLVIFGLCFNVLESRIRKVFV